MLLPTRSDCAKLNADDAGARLLGNLLIKGFRCMWFARLVQGILVLVLVSAGSGVSTASPGFPDTEENRRLLAERLAAVTLPVILRDLEERAMTDQGANRDPELHWRLFREELSVEEVKKIVVPTIAKHFTSAEISALLDFYESPDGNSILHKLGGYTAELQSAILAMVVQAVKRARASMPVQEE